MKNFLFLLILLGLIACDDNQQVAAFISANIIFSVKSTDGSDLLNPDNSTAYNKSDIRIYHLVDGEFEEANNPNLDYPRDFRIIEYPNSYAITVFGDVFNDNDIVKTLVKWNASDTDTLEYTVAEYANGNTILINKVWFNGTEIWAGEKGDDIYFEIVK